MLNVNQMALHASIFTPQQRRKSWLKWRGGGGRKKVLPEYCGKLLPHLVHFHWGTGGGTVPTPPPPPPSHTPMPEYLLPPPSQQNSLIGVRVEVHSYYITILLGVCDHTDTTDKGQNLPENLVLLPPKFDAFCPNIGAGNISGRGPAATHTHTPPPPTPPPRTPTNLPTSFYNMFPSLPVGAP